MSKASMQDESGGTHLPSNRPTYRPLHLEADTIRLMKLSPGQHYDLLVITLTTERLLNVRPFDALSYVWGTEQSNSTALLNGRGKFIGKNLDAALRQLRHPTGTRRLWVDAICINQEDILERNAQVSLMGKIFASAQTVIIWLGLAELPAARSFINSVRTFKQKRRFTYTHQMYRFYSLPWFQRMWIIQEFALAKNPIVYYGELHATWQEFYSYFEKANELYPSGFAESQSSRVIWVELKTASKQLNMLTKIRSYGSDSDRSNFGTFLAATAESISSDPRDKVYGILGMATFSSPNLQILPDYSLSVIEVFRNATRSMILDPECFTQLYSNLPLHPVPTSYLHGAHCVTGLPSWVPDLTISSQYREIPSHYLCNRPRHLIPRNVSVQEQIKKLKGLAPLASITTGSQIMQVAGTFLGTVTQTSLDALFTQRQSMEHLRRTEISASTLETTYYNIAAPRNITFQNYFGTLLAGAKRIADADMLSGSPNFSSYVDLFHLGRINKYARDRIVFVSAEGHIGLTYHPDPTGIQEGDCLVGLFGINMPFILRPVLEDRYIMINIAHVQDHVWGNERLQNAASEGICVDDVWADLPAYGLQQFDII